jgi:peptidyl-prolyl cis-trans isomerase B (cyclophilin B)
VLLAGFVILFTVLLGLAAYGVNRILNPPAEVLAAPCPAPPSGHPAVNANHTYSSAPASTLQPDRGYTAVMCTTKGVIRIHLRAAEAPKTVNAFVFLVNNGYYDGLTFHRVCPSASDSSCGPTTGGIHIAQGGDPKGDGTGRNPGFTIPDETPVGKYTTATVALARPANADGTKLPNSSGGQFFINTAANNFAPDYNLFGDVTSGLGVAQRLVKGDVMIWVAIETGAATSPAPSSSGAASPAASPVASPAAVTPSPSPS